MHHGQSLVLLGQLVLKFVHGAVRRHVANRLLDGFLGVDQGLHLPLKSVLSSFELLDLAVELFDFLLLGLLKQVVLGG